MFLSTFQFLNLTLSYNNLLIITSVSQNLSNTALTYSKSLNQPSKEMLWNIISLLNTTPFWQTMLLNLKLFKEFSTTKSLILQSFVTCLKMLVKLYGQNICIRKSLAQSLNSHKMLSIHLKLKSIMETTTH